MEIAERGESFAQIVDIGKDAKVERGVTELDEQDSWFRIAQYVWMVSDSFPQNVFDELRVRSVGDANREIKTSSSIVERPVRYRGRYKFAVGDDGLCLNTLP